MIAPQSFQYFSEDIVKSFQWLSHAEHGFTELAAFHPNYRPGREHFEFNLKNGFLPKTWYVNSERQVLAFVEKYHREHICCYGINPRSKILKNKKGYVRSAKDSDIEILMNFYLDFDMAFSEENGESLLILEELLDEIEFFLRKQGIKHPVRAFTGNGYHLLFAIPLIKVEEHPDIKARLKKFRDIIHYEFSDDLKTDGINLDSTFDLRRMAKIYGTKKPFKGSKLSKFYGGKHMEDPVLGEYLISLDLDEPNESEISFSVPNKLPEKFMSLLKNDIFIRKLWSNKRKTLSSDVSRSGYDFSLVKACIDKGITDINDLMAILALRPEGSFRKSGKNERYIRQTIGNAIIK